MKHLNAAALEVMDEAKNRIEFAQKNHWIGYTGALNILDRLDDALAYPRTLQMPNVLIVGRSGDGKSSILGRFVSRHPVQITPTGAPIAPILQMEMPETPNETEFWSTILWALGILHSEKDPAAIKKRQAISCLQYANVRMLVIDNFNNLSNAARGAGDFLAAIRELCDELRLSVVAAGTKDAIKELNSDPQMKSRFDTASLGRWKLDVEYLRLLVSYECLLPLAEPSGLSSRALATAIYEMAGDTIGGTINLLKAATVRAIETGVEKITLPLLEDLPWTPPL